MCAHLPLYDRYESLPAWVQDSLARHKNDPRPYLYGLDQLENADTHDPIWNAAQRQLRREGRLHNYLRMLWGKKILEWTRSPEEALDIMIHLNNKCALDGRNPNSYSGIFWILGRYDRPWAPERPVFGKIRYMSSDSTRRKLRLKQYLRSTRNERLLESIESALSRPIGPSMDLCAVRSAQRFHGTLEPRKPSQPGNCAHRKPLEGGASAVTINRNWRLSSQTCGILRWSRRPVGLLFGTL